VGIVSWALWGLVVGMIARALLPGRQRLGIVLTIIIGIAGSLVGGFIATEALNIADNDKFDFGSFIIAVVGSVILLAVFDRVSRILPDRERDRDRRKPA
jgi:uncharacterized membrane protein YeaQ/YmgE (transglycosylase-associated protein family)